MGLLLAPLLLLALLQAGPGAAWAAELRVDDLQLAPCPSTDVGAQPGLRRAAAASCYALRGTVINGGGRPVVDTDVYGRIVDASGEPVLPNRTRLGSIGDVPPGRSSFALRLAIPAGTPGPFEALNVRARGFSAPVRTRAGVDDELLPLEQQLAG